MKEVQPDELCPQKKECGFRGFLMLRLFYKGTAIKVKEVLE